MPSEIERCENHHGDADDIDRPFNGPFVFEQKQDESLVGKLDHKRHAHRITDRAHHFSH